MPHSAVQISLQLVIISILTLITVAAFTHIATMLIFRRLVVGKPASHSTRNDRDVEQHDRVVARHPVTESRPQRGGAWSEEFFVPVLSFLPEAAEGPVISRVRRSAMRVANAARSIPSSIQRGLLGDSAVTRELYVTCYHHRASEGSGKMLLLCNPSGETVQSITGKAVSLSEAIGYDSITMFDYRPTGRSCKGIVAPDTATMLEDAESVLQWITTVKDIQIENIAISGISLGGVQAMRLAARHPESKQLLLINTFASFYCMLGNAAPLLFPGVFRIGGTSDFLPNLTHDLTNLTTQSVVVMSVEEDERIPARCTEEMVATIRNTGKVEKMIHLIVKGTHARPRADHATLETMREFLGLSEPLTPYEGVF